MSGRYLIAQWQLNRVRLGMAGENRVSTASGSERRIQQRLLKRTLAVLTRRKWLWLAADMNRRNFQLPLLLDEIHGVTVLRGRVLAVGLEIDRPEESGERHAIIPGHA